MCAPLLLPCDASYIAVLTRISCSVSGAGVDMLLPTETYTDVFEFTPVPSLTVPAPVLVRNLDSPTVLVDLPLNRLLLSRPFTEKLLLVSRWPFAQIAWLPRPPLLPDPVRKSALMPGLRI